MANENLIAYQQILKQANLDNISTYQQTLESLDQAIVQMNNNIDAYNSQKDEINDKVTEAQNGNTLIDQTIAILSQ